MAEWLRRWIANPLFFERASSNLADVDIYFLALFSFFLGAKRTDQRCSNRKTKGIECSGFRYVLFLIFVALPLALGTCSRRFLFVLLGRERRRRGHHDGRGSWRQSRMYLSLILLAFLDDQTKASR